MKIYIIRHGQTEFNKKGLINGNIDSDLTPEGIEQAEIAADFIQKTIKRMYVSSLGRARKTAEILNETLKASMSFHDELKEVHFGNLEGTTFKEEYKERHRKLDYDWVSYGGEDFNQVKTRVLKVLKKIKEENSDGEALIVAHGGIILLLHFLEYGEELQEIKNTSLHSFDLDKILK